MDHHSPVSTSITRRDLLKVGGTAAVAGLASGANLLAPETARAQVPKRGGTLRLTFQSDPVTGFDPQQTISFVTMVPLSFVYSRLVKVKAGPSVKPMTYPLEPDLAESWTQPNDTTFYDIQRYLAEQALFGANGSTKVVSAWDPHIKNFMPNNGFDFGGRMMAAWIDK